MNYAESLAQLEKEKQALEKELGKVKTPLDSINSTKQLKKQKLELVKKVIADYSLSSFQEPDSDTIDEVFKKFYSFDQQKTRARKYLLRQKYFKAENVKITQKI